jgi:integrase
MTVVSDELKLTPMGLKALAKTIGRHKDGGGLELRIDEQTAKGKTTRRQRWVFRFTWNGKDRELGLGGYPDVTLKMARDGRDTARKLLQTGRDPIAERAAQKAPVRTIPTFDTAARAYIQKHGAGWNRVHRHQWELTTGTYCDQIASKAVDQITTLDIDQLLAAVHEHAPVTAHRLRTRIAAVIDEAWMIHRWSETLVNPAAFKRLLPKREKRIEHHAAMPFADVPTFVDDLRKVNSIAARALEFCILTATRTGETLGSEWSEIDLESRKWTIPAARMKGVGEKRREHVVPLSDRAVELLTELWENRENGFVFPGRSRGGCLNPIALKMLVRKMRRGLTVHGFRSSFRDWCGDAADVPREIAEAALAHIVGGTEGAYRRGTALERRRRLMEQWADHCKGTQPASNVVALRA